MIEFYWYIWYILDIYHSFFLKRTAFFQMYLSMCDTMKLDWIKRGPDEKADVGHGRQIILPSGYVIA